ncbi:MAG: cbb3-type cytochrome oxidase assembly protein CcoS [Aureliella sp.]
MSVLYVALPVALALGSLAVVAFIWATRGGQFDDLETPRWRILADDQPNAKSR